MSKKNKINKEDNKQHIKVNKKDSFGLFDGGFKAVEFESKKHKQNRHNNRKNIKNYDDID